MKKFGLSLLFFAAFQMISVIIIYDFYAVYRLKSIGNADLHSFSNIPQIIVMILLIEAVISISLIVVDIKNKNK
ncbi:MAG: hypothetical protein WBA54_11355 [Acidaminobacteraceae bacterium]